MTICNDLHLGGALTSTGITGTTSINSTALHVVDWAPIFGTPGVTGRPVEVAGRPGARIAGDRLPKPRFPTLVVQATRFGPTGVHSLAEVSQAEQVWENTDLFLDLASELDTYLEVDLPDGTSRFLQVSALDPGQASDWRQLRRFSIPLVSDWGWWRAGGSQGSEVISGVDTVTVGGRKTVYDPVLVFAGDGTFTHNDEGWAITVVGSGAAVTVDLGARTVTEAGAAATNRMRRTDRDWGWLLPGVNNVTTDVSVTVTWRNQYA